MNIKIPEDDKRKNGMISKAEIFISIAAFCDPLLIFTIKSAIEKAKFPERLHFGIVDQSFSSIESELPATNGRTTYLHLSPVHSRGVSWARAVAMTLYANEDYFLQIDSHTCFDRNWDITLVDTIETISSRTGNKRIIVSTRPFAFEFLSNGEIRKKRFTASTLKLVPKSHVIDLANPVVLFRCENSNEVVDLPGIQVSAAFLFTRGHFVEEIPYDPYMYFHGEEQSVSVRAYTHGWDIWHPNSLPLYHLYKRREVNEAPLHWDDEFESRRSEKWQSMRKRANMRLKQLFQGVPNGVYSQGCARKIEQYFEQGSFKVRGE